MITIEKVYNEIADEQLVNRIYICKECGAILTCKIDKPAEVAIIVKMICKKCLNGNHKD